MADMGFMPAVRRLLDQTSDDRQTVLFSATLDGDVAKLTPRLSERNRCAHEVGEETPDITVASHVFWKSAKGRPDEDHSRGNQCGLACDRVHPEPAMAPIV